MVEIGVGARGGMADTYASGAYESNLMEVQVLSRPQKAASFLGLERRSATARAGVEQIFSKKLCVTKSSRAHKSYEKLQRIFQRKENYLFGPRSYW